VIFTKRLRDGVRSGRITCSVRIWMRPHVKVGHRYRMDEGAIEVLSIQPIQLTDISPALARESGFQGIVDLLKVAKHGPGENVYLVRFRYIGPKRSTTSRRTPAPSTARGRANRPARKRSGTETSKRSGHAREPASTSS